MAMTRSPRLISRIGLLVALGLFVVARRFLRDPASGQTLFPVLMKLVLVVGAGSLLAGTALQAMRWSKSKGARKRAEGTLLLCYGALILAGIVYFFTTATGMGWLGLDELSAQAARRYDVVMTVLAALLAACAVIPALLMEATVGEVTTDEDDDAVELSRTREMGLAGLTIALAAGFLMVTCNVAREKNIRKDVSYMRTSQPGESTRKIVETMSEPVRALLFFPELNEVGGEVKAYFQELARQTKGKVVVEQHDRLLSITLARKYQVGKDGTVVLVRGADDKEKHGKFELDTDIEKHRRRDGKLRVLDQTVNTELLKILREKRKAYLTVGHGEINDPDSLPPHMRGRLPDARTQVIKNILTALNYESKNLGAMDGLVTKIPDDATFVMVLGPKQAFAPAELDTLARYLDDGGRLLIAMDPEGDFRLGPLEGRLGTGLGEERPGQDARIGIVTDDKNYLPQRGNESDRRLALTNQFSSHASTTSLSRGDARNGILLETAGILTDREFTVAGEKPKRTYVIRTMGEAWVDYDGDLRPGAEEKRDRYNVGAAIEGAKRKTADGGEADGFRAMVFSDQDLFADRMVQTRTGQIFVETNGRSLPIDAIRWLGGEETISGIINDEKDKEIKQTKREQAAWFTATTILAPLALFGAGMLFGRPRRRRASASPSSASAKESTP
ncbi:MAG: Gldg family protein [Kofleriaceae bacterium]|nr:Gldg family protein [Kofleriaceae bacterium]